MQLLQRSKSHTQTHQTLHKRTSSTEANSYEGNVHPGLQKGENTPYQKW